MSGKACRTESDGSGYQLKTFRECAYSHRIYCAPYPYRLGGKVALADHEVPGVVQFDYGPRVGLNFSFKGLMLLQLTLRNRRDQKFRNIKTQKNFGAPTESYI